MIGWRTITSVVRTPCVSCSSLATALCALRLSYVFQKTKTNRKENEHVENSLRQPCDLVFRTTVLRCCLQHREAAIRNQEICRLLLIIRLCRNGFLYPMCVSYWDRLHYFILALLVPFWHSLLPFDCSSSCSLLSIISI